jgi:hypothetical protein
MQAGIIVVDAVDDDGPLLDDDTAAFVACGVCIALNPGLDDGARTDVLAMAPALTYAMSRGKTDHAGDVTAADDFVLISRTREAEPVSALGLLATVIAHEHGRSTASAAFEYTVPVFELARRAACTACARWLPRARPWPIRLPRLVYVAVSGVSAAQKRRVWDLNPRGRVNALVVFKTTAIGH